VTPETANADRVRIDALKWIAAKLHPKVYGDYAGRPDSKSVTVNLGQLHLQAASMSTEELWAAVERDRGAQVLSSPFVVGDVPEGEGPSRGE
jgi:hypothetical protein